MTIILTRNEANQFGYSNTLTNWYCPLRMLWQWVEGILGIRRAWHFCSFENKWWNRSTNKGLPFLNCKHSPLIMACETMDPRGKPATFPNQHNIKLHWKSLSLHPQISSHPSSKKILFAADRGYYRIHNLSKCREQLTVGCSSSANRYKHIP